MNTIAVLMMISALVCPPVIIFLSIKIKRLKNELNSYKVQETKNLQSLLNGGEIL